MASTPSLTVRRWKTERTSAHEELTRGWEPSQMDSDGSDAKTSYSYIEEGTYGFT